MNLLEARGLVKTYSARAGMFTAPETIHAVDGVDLHLAAGETLGLVGESGCGKSTLARLLMLLEPPDAGSISFEDRDISTVHGAELKQLRRTVQVIFQDPFGSLNPRKKIGSILAEPLIIHREGNRETRRNRTMELLDLVGLQAEMLSRYPHEFSGGQRQRICIARALALNPRLLICDEPVSALDVSIQAQVITLLQDLQQRLDLSMLFISHDLAVVGYLSHRVAVMYRGRIVETAPTAPLFAEALHPYTRTLMNAVPVPEPGHPLSIPDRENGGGESSPAGCAFAPRCPEADETCRTTPPTLKEIRPGHLVACHHRR